MRSVVSFVSSLLCSFVCFGQQHTLKYIDTRTDASFRGLSVADGGAVWVSGSKGWVGRSGNNGADWIFRQVSGYEQCDFRTLYAFDANTAIIANAGSPAYILRTTDSGNTWTQVYKNADSAAFIDGVDFWCGAHHKRGVMYGDPINGRMLLLYTNDRGKTWRQHWQRHSPQLAKGQASFAASGTAIRCCLHRSVVVATGGSQSQLFFSRHGGRRWRAIATPMLSGSPASGIFSFAFGRAAWHWYIAGGDYQHDTVRTANLFFSSNKGKSWRAPSVTTRGYRECLARIENDPQAKKSKSITLLALGPTGIDISADAGASWQPLSNEKGFHVIKPAADQRSLFIAGSNGKLAIMTLAH